MINLNFIYNLTISNIIIKKISRRLTKKPLVFAWILILVKIFYFFVDFLNLSSANNDLSFSILLIATLSINAS